MSGGKRFNVRVYGIWIEGDRVLVNDEMLFGKEYTKFPGGGLEFGEGTIDALKREWKEELGMDIKVLKHFYTTDYFQPSFFDESQVISIFYLVKPINPDGYILNRHEHESSYWIKLEDITDETFLLPIEKRVGKMLKKSSK
ncbi:MAG: NUDIX domain-containing protein [Chitinophagales bacterium]|nr:NUDIX domain-containing protein [Chitinophagaceae bacterium]MCB9063513.1 NUDIX domain-containing protein [Chitinophagales bacterium]